MMLWEGRLHKIIKGALLTGLAALLKEGDPRAAAFHHVIM